MKLSKNLSLKEVIKSDTAIRKGISNEPTQQHLQNLKILAEKIFQPVREYFGEPIYLSSGYRSRALNKAIGGAIKSHHCKGMALDFDQDYRNTGITNKMVFDYVKDNLQFTQLIWENGTDENPEWVHVSYDPKDLKKEVLKLKNKIYTKIY
jgi:zinc D-Ala-D-Ala carboxypeptidase